MDDTVQKITVKEEGFPTAAIVVIAVSVYMFLFFIMLIIRKICISKGNDCCPSWCAEMCMCNTCCLNQPSPCTVFCAESCNCPYPNKRSCMDVICPSKRWCDDIFCCCLSQEPEGKCLCCNFNDGCCDFGETCGCSGCKEYCESCKCECCAQPETIDCCCIEIKLSGATQRAMANGMNNGYNGGYNNQGYMNQGLVDQQPQYNHPGFPQQSGYHPRPSFHQQPHYNQQGSYGNQGEYNNPQQMFSGQQGYNQRPSFNHQPGPSQQQNLFSAQSSAPHPGQSSSRDNRTQSNVGR